MGDTLERPLHGNKLQHVPFGPFIKPNVTTNVVFPKTSVFYTLSPGDKENAYGSPEAGHALV
jgi:hypothetical protein